MGKSDQEHFQAYRLQTRIKHEIICDYLPAYFNVIKKWADKLVFIDGFAGRGHYLDGDNGERVAGSPLRALELIVRNADFMAKARCVFVENDRENFEELEASVKDFVRLHEGVHDPIMVRGKFSEQIGGLLRKFEGEGKVLAPTFMLVDPCGVEDVSMAVVAGVLAMERCEVFVFFNLDGIRRIAGLAKNKYISPILTDLLGSEKRAQQLVASFLEAPSPDVAEQKIVSAYVAALKESGAARFVIPFRVENERKRTTSHYLIHATKHHLGFKIMKDVMWEKGRQDGEEEGQLQLVQASGTGAGALIRPDLADAESRILSSLAGGPQRVSVYREEWVCQPDDMLSSSAYRRLLLRMESEGKIIVLDENAQSPLPASERRSYRGSPSLADRLFVSLA